MKSPKTMANLHKQLAQARRLSDPQKRQQSIFLTSLLTTRMEQGITQAQLAERSGLKQSAIARIERGKVNPTLDTVLKLAAALNRDLVLE